MTVGRKGGRGFPEAGKDLDSVLRQWGHAKTLSRGIWWDLCWEKAILLQREGKVELGHSVQKQVQDSDVCANAWGSTCPHSLTAPATK